MTVLNSVIGTIKPGRYDDFLSQGLEVSKLVERHGARNVRLLTAGAAGEQQGRWVFNTEHEGLEEYGAFIDELMRDGEMLALMTRLQSEANPVLIEQQTVAVEVPIGRKTKAKKPAPIVETHLTRVTPGRLDRAIADAKRACDFVEKHGARNARLCQLLYAGSFSGTYMITWEFENMQALGRAAAAWTSDPKGQELAATLTATDAPTTIVFSGIYNEVPL